MNVSIEEWDAMQDKIDRLDAELALLKNGQDGWVQYTEEAATNAALRTELAEYRAESNHTWAIIRAGRDVAEAAITRVRELCENEHATTWDVLRALDGAE